MRRAARTIAGQLRGQLTEAFTVGALAVALVSFLGVGREGLEQQCSSTPLLMQLEAARRCR
jgi:hypothetical protein